MLDATPGVGFEAALSDQIMTEDASALEAAVTGKDGTEAAPDPAKEEEKPAGDESTESSEEGIKPEDSEESEESAEEEEEAKKEEAPTTFKVGNKEYGDVKDVIKEANSIIGDNGRLKGDIERLTTQVEEAKGEMAKVIDANKKWAAWYQENVVDGVIADDADEPPAKPEEKPVVDKDTLKAELKAELLHEQNVEKLMTSYREQLVDIRATSHASEVETYIEKLADKINPETDIYFSPIEAYEYACTRLGLTPELGEKAVKAAPKEPPKKTANQAAIKSASRPGNAVAPAPKAPGERTYVDEAFDSAFPLL